MTMKKTTIQKKFNRRFWECNTET